MINQTKAKMVSTLIGDYLSRGWYINFGPNQATLGDATRFYITDGTNTICFKVYEMGESETKGFKPFLDIISYPGIGSIDDILWDKNGNLEARIELD